MLIILYFHSVQQVQNMDVGCKGKIEVYEAYVRLPILENL